eukprot:TRINITY_DN9275_c0_g1_i1.p1 TRINITY_DN9275_c0_g1~~TRINITY_DN9275_c0_g1_i1.p1  ORF type:complete len:404 (+),score=96.74 TRINITY_DN9275_c0_g1_i1:125-1213(+)
MTTNKHQEDTLASTLNQKWSTSPLSSTANFVASEEWFRCFARSKKTEAKAWAAMEGYVRWSNLIDFHTLSWKHIEHELNRGFLTLPSYGDWALTKRKNPLIFFESNAYDPQKSGMRNLLAVVWVVSHYTLDHAPSANETGVSVAGNQSGFSVSRFVPEIQKAMLDSLTGVLPVRVREVFLMDTPFFSKLVWKVVKLWLKESTREKFKFVNQKTLADSIDSTSRPLAFGGARPLNQAEWVAQLREYYVNEFRPRFSAVTSREFDPEESYTHWLSTDPYHTHSKTTREGTVGRAESAPSFKKSKERAGSESGERTKKGKSGSGSGSGGRKSKRSSPEKRRGKDMSDGEERDAGRKKHLRAVSNR